MNSDDDLVVSDFGLGRVLDSKTTRKTATGTRLGTFLYCSPEQMMDFKRADHRSDIFSLGRMLYELYTGELTSAIQDLSSVPALIAPIVERATATNPDNRYPTVDKMLGEFDGAMEVMLGVVESGSLSDLVEKLRAAPSWSDEEITRHHQGPRRRTDRRRCHSRRLDEDSAGALRTSCRTIQVSGPRPYTERCGNARRPPHRRDSRWVHA